jgi:pyridoxal phosphate enzyme (YggS family)
MSVGIAANVARVRGRIAAAAARAGRAASDVTLIAVSKTRTPGEIEAACRAGIRHLGENRVEEAESKRPQLELPGVTWHMIGHLQSRKARRAVACFDTVHSVDSVRLAQRLDRLAREQGTALPVLLEVNVSGEASKYGLSVSDRSALEASVAQIVSLSHLRVEGLMTLAFISPDQEAVRPVFARLRALGHQFRERFPESAWEHLSMGMTDDFEVAVEEGATMVRVGRAIFGPRE